MNQIHSVRRKYRAHCSPNNASKLSATKIYLQSIMTSAKMSYETYPASSNNSNKIYKYVTSLSKKSSIPTCMHYGSKLSQSPSETAQLFNDYFYSVYNKNASYSLTDSVETNTIPSYINMSISDVWTSLTSLDPSKAHRIDNLNPKVLKYCATSLSEPIHHLFCQSINHGQLPLEWKIHHIILIFKSGNRSQVNNYRPISLLCIISKVLEKIVYNHIIGFLLNSIYIYQFGFLPGRSSLQQLLIFVDILLQAKEHKAVADVIHLDIRKAFDTVSHHKLLAKLQNFGISGNLLRWFQGYLANRSQCVSIK